VLVVEVRREMAVMTAVIVVLLNQCAKATGIECNDVSTW